MAILEKRESAKNEEKNAVDSSTNPSTHRRPVTHQTGGFTIACTRGRCSFVPCYSENGFRSFPGSGYRLQRCFARFVNVPGLMQHFREVTGMQRAEMLKLPIPNLDQGRPIGCAI
ncbi:MAG: hypothetical protein QOI07_3202 [Verrucomicrobiota bacterium]|jgi:hypothetical protein